MKIKSARREFRIGQSSDVHRFEKGRKLVLGGVNIPFEYGLAGHSDADVVYHATAEAIIGALGLGDMGTLFPDTDSKYLNIDSSYFIKKVYETMKQNKYEINNLDLEIHLEKPNLSQYKMYMRDNIAILLKTNVENINIKATRGEGLGFIGRQEGIRCEAIVLLKSITDPIIKL